jgi:pimeloyl-ACP methyl ester carboxylesterase/DNA-binding CsgD family transcriptional regulator
MTGPRGFMRDRPVAWPLRGRSKRRVEAEFEQPQGRLGRAVSPQPASATTDPDESGGGRGIEQEIRFCAVGDARVAYATVGSGPALLLPALWISHLELEWEFDEFRAFVGALARTRTVIRYDRLGTGLSDRDPAPDGEMRTIEAVAGALGVDEFSLLGISRGGCTAATFAARYPARVRSIVLVGAYAQGARIASAQLRKAMASTVRAHWGVGSRVLADVWLPGADSQTRERFTRLQRAAASADVAAAMLEAVYEEDARDVLPQVAAPALVLHRRHDRAIPFAQGREVAARLPGARLVALDGEMHPPWLGDSAAVLRPMREFLDANHPAGDRWDARPEGPLTEPRPEGPLTEREREVLRLVAEGLSDGEVAERLIVSPHTVHRHMANIRTKLNQSSRAAAAAYAARRGLI